MAATAFGVAGEEGGTIPADTMQYFSDVSGLGLVMGAIIIGAAFVCAGWIVFRDSAIAGDDETVG